MEKNRETYLRDIPDGHPLLIALQNIANDIRLFIELSLHETDHSWEEWLPLILKKTDVRCWEKSNCTKKECPAYMDHDGRCWLVAGTICAGDVQGELALKYKNCTECDVYKESIYRDPVSEIYEHLITLVHNFKATQEKLKNMATRDFLTGLYNRHYFNETIAREIERARRHNESLSVIMIDIDKFKQINDRFGHLHGDGILREFATILKKAARKSDILCRYGGDEFLIITPNKDCKTNDAIIERINSSVAEWNSQYASDSYELSLSIGCAVWNNEEDLQNTLHEADSMMYQNKKSKLGEPL